jgi:hypothetical protein
MVSSASGAAFALRYTGGEIAIVGERGPPAGRIRLTLDGRTRAIDLTSPRTHVRPVLFLSPSPATTA